MEQASIEPEQAPQYRREKLSIYEIDKIQSRLSAAMGELLSAVEDSHYNGMVGPDPEIEKVVELLRPVRDQYKALKQRGEG